VIIFSAFSLQCNELKKIGNAGWPCRRTNISP